MADIFISYAREDQPLATVLADQLEQAGWAVWWDRDIPVGKDYDLIIDAELESARCVIVLWTKDSVLSRNVKDEANEALTREKLLPIQIGAVRPPMGFRMIQSMIWNEVAVNDHYIRELLSHLQGTIGPAITLPKKRIRKPVPRPEPEPIIPKPEPPAIEKKKRPVPKSIPPLASGITEKRLINILHKFNTISSIFYAPYIPDTKEANARKACFIPDGERIVALIDLTVFGAADDCMVFTTERIFHHNINSKAIYCPYVDFPGIVFQVESDGFFSKKLMINNDVVDMGGLSSPVSNVVALLNEIKKSVVLSD